MILLYRICLQFCETHISLYKVLLEFLLVCQNFTPWFCLLVTLRKIDASLLLMNTHTESLTLLFVAVSTPLTNVINASRRATERFRCTKCCFPLNALFLNTNVYVTKDKNTTYRYLLRQYCEAGVKFGVMWCLL